MTGIASFACESTPRRDIAVLRIRIESRCGQNSCERRRSPCLSHGHTPWPLTLNSMPSSTELMGGTAKPDNTNLVKFHRSRRVCSPEISKQRSEHDARGGTRHKPGLLSTHISSKNLAFRPEPETSLRGQGVQSSVKYLWIAPSFIDGGRVFAEFEQLVDSRQGEQVSLLVLLDTNISKLHLFLSLGLVVSLDEPPAIREFSYEQPSRYLPNLCMESSQTRCT